MVDSLKGQHDYFFSFFFFFSFGFLQYNPGINFEGLENMIIHEYKMWTNDRVLMSYMIEIKECEFQVHKVKARLLNFSDFSCGNANKNFLKLKIPISQI